jgi:DNA-binding MarR family transcriptional regulator
MVNYLRGWTMAKSIQVLLRDAHAAVDADVREALAGAGFDEIKPGHAVVLRNLGEDGARPSEIAARAGVTRQAVTKVVRDLERLGLVRRHTDPADGRGVIVRYTERGREGLELARRRMLAIEDELAAQIGAERWAVVRSALEALHDRRRPAATVPIDIEPV